MLGFSWMNRAKHVPDDLGGYSIATQQRLAGPFDEISFRRGELEGQCQTRKRDWRIDSARSTVSPCLGLGAEQAAFVQGKRVAFRCVPIDGETVGTCQASRTGDAKPVIAGLQGKNGPIDDLKRLANRLVARFG